MMKWDVKKNISRLILIVFLGSVLVLTYQNCSEPFNPNTATKSSTSTVSFINLTDGAGSVVTVFPRAQSYMIKANFAPLNAYTYSWKVDCNTNTGIVTNQYSGSMISVNCDGSFLQLVVTASISGKSYSSPLITLFPGAVPTPTPTPTPTPPPGPTPTPTPGPSPTPTPTPPPGTLAVTINGGDTMMVDSCSAYKLMVVDTAAPTVGKVVNTNVIVNVTSSSNTLKFYTSSNCTVESANFTIATGTSEKAIYLKDSIVESTANTAISGGYAQLAKSVSVTTPSGALTGNLDFGGMYGNSQYVNYNNPNTNAQSCPAGYFSQQVKGSPNKDYNLYFCYRNHQQGVNPLYDFGGMYGDWQYGFYANPATNAKSCPTGYTSKQVYGSPNMDYNIYYCYRNYDAGNNQRFEFSGMYGESQYGGYYNPLTFAHTCLAGYSVSKFTGSPNMDYDSSFCYKNQGITAPAPTPPPYVCGTYTQADIDNNVMGCDLVNGFFDTSSCSCVLY